MFKIYIITCLSNKKIYVGQTSRDVLLRFKEHINDASSNKNKCRKLCYAIRKYGSNNFIVENILECKTQKDADLYEIYFISYYDSIKYGYNLQVGGYNGSPSEETRKLMSESHMGTKNHFYGKTHTQDVKNYLSTINIGRIAYNKGIPQLKETKVKISISRTGLTVGENNPGAKLTIKEVEEIRQLFQISNLTNKEIAVKFNVSLSTIKRIKANTHWK